MYKWFNMKSLPASASILTILLAIVACIQLFGLAVANPFYDGGQVPADSETYPPAITIISAPKNDTVCAVNHMSFIFNVTAPESKTAYSTPLIYEVSYEADWREKPVTIFYQYYDSQERLHFSIQLSGIPEGNHSIRIRAIGTGSYVKYGPLPGAPNNALRPIEYKFYIESFVLINFTVDTIAPTVSVLSMENKTYTSADVPLSFAVNETVKQITYSLDGQDNVTAAGNTTLIGLPNGVHNVTVYAWDTAGNIGTSPTATFTVAKKEPTSFPITSFPTTLVIATASAASIAVVGTALSLYFKKHKHTDTT